MEHSRTPKPHGGAETVSNKYWGSLKNAAGRKAAY
jgi:hypothetical protein